MEVFPELYTTRLKLRKIQIEDMDALVQYANNKKISDNIVNIPYPYREPDAVFRMSYVVQGFKNKLRYVFAITLKETAEFIGEISLHFDNDKKVAQLGYWIGEPFWNQGIGTEAVQRILKFGFEKLNLSIIFATVHTENGASAQVLIKNGMTKHHENGNVIKYVHTKEDYDARQEG
jgi:[ribosomal protein S5]-alanine N-acetyltransferase